MAHNLIHRGLAKKNFKENSLKAFKYCFTKKYGIETDLHCTKDNIIICFHDFSLKKKFKTNKLIKNLTFDEINKIAKKFEYYVPQLKELVKISKNKNYLMLEIKPYFSKKNLVQLINQTKKLKFFSITSFNEKNIKNLNLLKKKMNLGLCFASTTPIERIIRKSKLKYVKILVMEKRFLSKKKLDAVNKPIYYYTARNKKIKRKYSNKNLIFENL
jgi:glycerophosphoryl diester phosphodiesterase